MPQDYSAFRPSKIWRRMSPERRAQAAELFWDDEQSAEQQVEACATIATHMKFRAKSVLNLPIEKKSPLPRDAAERLRHRRRARARQLSPRACSGR